MSAQGKIRVSFELGPTVYGQAVELECELAWGRDPVWTLTKHAANQRDETERIFGVTTAQLHAIAGALARAKGIAEWRAASDL